MTIKSADCFCPHPMKRKINNDCIIIFVDRLLKRTFPFDYDNSFNKCATFQSLNFDFKRIQIIIAINRAFFCIKIGPPSTSSVTKWIVHPVSVSPFFSTSSWTLVSIPPAYFGRRDGWTFNNLSCHARQNSVDKIHINPKSKTSLTLYFFITAVISASNSFLVFP